MFFLIDDFRIEYHGPGEDGQPIKNQGWRIYEARWHKTRRGLPVKRSRSQQKPRWALIEVCETEAEARELIAARKASGSGQAD